MKAFAEDGTSLWGTRLEDLGNVVGGELVLGDGALFAQGMTDSAFLGQSSGPGQDSFLARIAIGVR